MTIHVVVGPSCAGKSTFVREHAAPGVPRFDFDMVARAFSGSDNPHDYPEGMVEIVQVVRRGVVGWLLDDETSLSGDFWLIWNSPPPRIIERFAAVGAQFHVIDPGEETCIARALADDRPPGTVERIKQWYASPPIGIPGWGESEKGGKIDMQRKSFAVSVKSDSGEGAPPGRLVAYASVFDVIDSYGEVVRRGAFANTLAEWGESGKTIPLLWGHDMADPFSNIGGVVSAVEDDKGLKIVADMDLDNPKAAQVHKLLKSGRVTEMSFAFQYRDAALAVVDGQEVLEIRDLELFEVSVVPIGANREAGVVEVRSGDSAPAAPVVGEDEKSRLRALVARVTLAEKEIF